MCNKASKFGSLLLVYHYLAYPEYTHVSMKVFTKDQNKIQSHSVQSFAKFCKEFLLNAVEIGLISLVIFKKQNVFCTFDPLTLSYPTECKVYGEQKTYKQQPQSYTETSS